MRLAQVSGSLEHLNEFLITCCMQGEFTPRHAIHHLSTTMGYAALEEENPCASLMTKIETMVQELGETLPQEGYKAPMPTVEDKADVERLRKQFSEMRNELDALRNQKKDCEEGITQYSHFLTLHADVKELCNCKFIVVRFGFLPTVGYNKLRNNYEDNPYLFFVPCTETPKGCWGVYMAPLSRIQEVDGIFSMLYFERVRVPEAAGTPEKVIADSYAKLDGIERQIREKQDALHSLWKENELRVCAMYAAAKFHAELYSLRRYAAVKKGYFIYIGWVPAAKLDAVEQAVKMIPGVHFGEDETGTTKRRWWLPPFGMLSRAQV